MDFLETKISKLRQKNPLEFNMQAKENFWSPVYQTVVVSSCESSQNGPQQGSHVAGVEIK